MKQLFALFAVVFAVAVFGGLGVVLPNPVFANIVFLMVFVTLIGSVIGAIIGVGRTRDFLRGFAVFGIGCFLLTVLVGDEWSAARSQGGFIKPPPRPCFITSHVLAWAYDRLALPEIWTSGGTRVPAVHLLSVSPSQIPANLDLTEFKALMKIGQCLSTVLMGLIGGWIGERLNDGEVVESTGDA